MPPSKAASGDAARGSSASGAPRELERKLIESVVGRFEVSQLPGTPLIIDRALRASRRERDASQVCEWLALDPILSLRALDATADRTHERRIGVQALSLSKRVTALGPGLVKSMLMSAARCSLGPEPALLSARELGEFWIHALRAAFLSRSLAEICSYRSPDEAYLAGLLHDVGSFALLATVPNTLRSLVAGQTDAPWGAIPEHAGRLGTIHAAIGAALMEKLGAPFYVSDALLLHHAPTEELGGTHLLVRILCCAEALIHSRSPAHPLGAMADLLGTSSSAVSNAEKAAGEKVSAVLRGLGRLGLAKSQTDRTAPAGAAAPQPRAQQRLTETLVMRFVKEAEQPLAGDTLLERKSARESDRPEGPEVASAEEEGWSEALALHGINATASSILEQVVGEAVQSEAETLLRFPKDVAHALAEVLPLARVIAGIRCAAIFIETQGRESWPGWLADGEGVVSVELGLPTTGWSLVARAAREASAVSSYEEGKASQLTGLDLQIARLLEGDEIAAVPITCGEAASRGVIVFGTSAMKASRFGRALPFLSDLADLVARSSASAPTPGPAAGGVGESVEQVRTATRRLVHEARNPLSVLKTYLQIARTRAESGASLEKELEIANQEVQRVARVLDEIGNSGRSAVPRARPVELNRMIEDLLLLYGDALFGSKKIALSPALDASILPIWCDEEGLRQVLLNLLINASEALTSGGQVMVCTSDHVNYEGQVMVEISVADNGPGIAPEKVADLFASSAKATADSARGFGLPNSLAAVRAMGGHMLCRSRVDEGTTFAILLPRRVEAGPQTSDASVA